MKILTCDFYVLPRYEIHLYKFWCDLGRIGRPCGYAPELFIIQLICYYYQYYHKLDAIDISKRKNYKVGLTKNL